MALTPEELRQRIPNWSLESDGQLLQYMISIAKNLEEKCTKTRDNLNGLMLQVSQTELKLANATNQFSAVEQVKFVENRVEEDDESFYGLRRRRQQQGDDRKEHDATRERDVERSVDDLIQLAVDRSIEGMYQAYEKVTLELTDSDTDSDGDGASGDGMRKPGSELGSGKASVMRALPRHAFIDRPLPHVIGSKEWQSKWHVGLIDSDDESSSERKEEYSESSSATYDDGGLFPSHPNSKNHTPSESESSIWGADVGRKRAPSIDPSITGDDGSSVYSYASSSKPRTFPTHVARGVAPLASSLKPPSLFPELPPEEVDDVKGRGSAKGLFDESPEEEEEANPAPLPTPRQTVPYTEPPSTVPFFRGTVHQPARKIVNLFDDEPPPPQDQFDRPAAEPKRALNLFIDSEDEQETRKENIRNNNTTQPAVERAGPKPTVAPSGHPPAANPRTMTRLVDELNNNFRKQQQPTPSQPPSDARPATVSRSVPDRPPQSANLRPVVSNLFDDEPPVDEFDQLFSAASVPARAPPRNQPTAALPQPTFRAVVEKKPVNLFADDDTDEDGYDGIVVGSNERQPEPVRSPFISPSNRAISLPKPPESRVSAKKKSIFDESDSDGEKDAGAGLFAGVSKPVAAPGGMSVTQPPKAVKSIFSDSSEAEDDDDALFGHSSNVVKNKLDALKKQVAGNGTAKSSFVATVPAPVTVANSSERDNGKPASTTGKSLFDDDSDDEHDVSANGESALFGRGGGGAPLNKPIVTRPVSAPQKQEPPKVSLFDDELATEDDDLLAALKARNDKANGNELRQTERGVSVSAAVGSYSVREPKGATDGDLFASKNIESATNQLPSADMGEVKVSSGAEKTVPSRTTTASKTSIDSILVRPSSTVDRDPLSGYSAPADPKVSVIPKTPASAGSIRSMILQKSIFNSDTEESEEDDSIFGSPPISVPAVVEAKSGVATDRLAKPGSNACDSEGAQLGPDSNIVGEFPTKPSVEQVDPLVATNGFDVGNSSETGKREQAHQPNGEEGTPSNTKPDVPVAKSAPEDEPSELAEPPTNSIGEEPPEDTAAAETIEEVSPTVPPVSIFDDSPSDNEDENGLGWFVKEIASTVCSSDLASDSQSDPLRTVSEENLAKVNHKSDLPKIYKEEDVLKPALESAQPCLSSVEDAETTSKTPDEPSVDSAIPNDVIVPDDDGEAAPRPEQPPGLGMIANDIDYFLRTNEPVSASGEPSGADPRTPPVTPPPTVKSEPKSALNFSPIGLFDDVPPPDDDGDDDERFIAADRPREQRKQQFRPVDSVTSSPPVHDPPGYATESQSLNFIPNGSGGASSNRTRYLFDDEPPPDEADNGGSGFGESPPFPGAGQVSKALFDDRQRSSEGSAPVSLPSMAQEAAKTPPRPKVNKLNAKIAINVAALLPGARRPPTTVAAPVKVNDSPDPIPYRGGAFESSDSIDSTSPGPPQPPADTPNGEDRLCSLNKGRARIPTKRKPPSRHTLRAALPSPEAGQKEAGPRETDDDRIVVGSEEKMLHIEGGGTARESLTEAAALTPDLPYKLAGDFERRRDVSKLDPLVDRLSASVRSTTATQRMVRPDGNETGPGPAVAVVEKVPKKPNQPAQPKPKSIFGDSDSNGDSDDPDDFFSKLPAKVPPRVRTEQPPQQAPAPVAAGKHNRSIFGSDGDEDDNDDGDDIFGGKKSTLARQLKSKVTGAGNRGTSTSGGSIVASVKPPPAKVSTSLFGDDDADADDDDDLFGGTTKSMPNAPGMKTAAGRPVPTPLATTMTTTTTTTRPMVTTRAVQDPLADLLDS